MRAPEHRSSPEARALQGIFRAGRVSSTDAVAHTAKVAFKEDGDFVSFDLPVLLTRPGDYSLPANDTLVLCAMDPGADGVGWVLGCFYSEEDAAPTDEADARVVAGDDTRLGSHEAADKIALAPATKDEIQKAVDYAEGIALAIQAGVVVAQDGGASLKATIVAALPTKPTIEAPASEMVSAK